MGSQDKYLRSRAYEQSLEINEKKTTGNIDIILSVDNVLFDIKNSSCKNSYNAATCTDILLMTRYLQHALPELDAILYRIDLINQCNTSVRLSGG